MFDPFKDFDRSDYLRNVRKDKNASVVKRFEHDVFRANLDSALGYLAGFVTQLESERGDHNPGRSYAMATTGTVVGRPRAA